MTLEEEYIHFQESITSLNRAWRTLCELENTISGNAIWGAAYRMVIVEYCKPFKNSQINKDKRHRLKVPTISKDFIDLHNQLITLRDQVMAHFDLTPLNARLFYDRDADFSVPLIIKNNTPSLPSATEIKKLVEAVLDSLYQQQKSFDASFK